MADKKTSMGDDPLAWLTEGDEPDNARPEKTVKTRSRARRVAPRRPTVKAKTETELLEESFEALAPQGEELAALFYDRLFELFPDIIPLFSEVSVSEQQKKLLASLVLLIQNLHKPDVLGDYLKGLGARHANYGVTAEHYPLVAKTLLMAMEEVAGDRWTPEVEQAWGNTLKTVVTIMLDAYEQTPVETEQMTNSNKQTVIERNALDSIQTAVMMIDRDFTITYANQASIKLLTDNLAAMRMQFPHIDPTTIVGQNIDQFHKDPSVQRRILADPSNLPYEANIQVGPLYFRLHVTALYDDDDIYIGNVLEWSNTTEEKKKNTDVYAQIDAINKSMGVISFNMDGSIIDINDNFLSAVGYTKEQVIGKHHRMFAGPELAASPEYVEFWAKLNRGEFDSGEYKRIASDGREVWLQASYNPIFDLNGKPYKVVKYASDITEQKELQFTVNNMLSSTMTVMNAMSVGDLTQAIYGDFEGDFALLQTAINDTVNKMADIVREINEASSNVSTAASEISAGNIDLSQRTEQQAASLEETASSMEELTSTVRQNADNARQANLLASSSREQAEKGGVVINKAIEAMSAINTSSKKVSDIIGVIDEIAFQTNLLSLNAAVEAARAGEQGRGFAVVASEVRNLAQRSASAAKEIKALINDSGEKVKEGSMLVDESGRTLEEIVASSKKVGDIISGIAAAGVEQAQGIDQVNKAVTQMDEMTQQNAALVEQAAAASESLDEQGKGLQQMITFFNLGEQEELKVAAPAPMNRTFSKPEPVLKPTVKSTPKPIVSSDDEWDEF